MADTQGNVSNKPLNVVAAYYWNQSNNNAAENSAYVQTQTPLTTLLPLVPAKLQSQLAPLKPYLTENLGTIFNNYWASVQAADQTNAATLFTKQINGGGGGISNVNCALASSGTLMAFAFDAVPNAVPSPRPASLDLEFQLPGGNFHFSAGPIGANWKVDFDASVTVSTPVPVLPFSITPTVVVGLANAALHADNVGADFVEGLDNLGTALGNFFTNGNFESDIDFAQAAVADQDNDTFPFPVSANSPFVSLLTSLNGAGQQCIALGFNQCAFSIVGGDALTLTLTHPLDAGPQLRDPNHPQGEVLTVPATLSTNTTQVKPGQTITASGAHFPVASVSRLPITWNNTSSGTPSGAQIKYEVTGKNTASPISVPVSALSNGIYAYTAGSLTADSEYSFWARCGDELTWSKWSDTPLKVKTAKTTTVDLRLKPANNASAAGVNVGSADLSQTSNDWSAPAKIPANTAAGVYDLTAELSGDKIAATTITVVSTLKPTLYIIDTSHNDAIVASPVFLGGTPFTIKGEGFPSSTVTVTLDGAAAGKPNAPSGEFTLPLKVPGDANSNSQTVTIVATSGSTSATLSFETVGPPK